MGKSTVVSFTKHLNEKKGLQVNKSKENIEKAMSMFDPVDGVLDAIEENGDYGIAITLSEDHGLVVAASFQLNHDDILQLLEAAILNVKENH